MKRFDILFIIITLTGLCLFPVPTGTAKPPEIAIPGINPGPSPLYFIPNQGQVNEQVKFYARTSKYTLWLTREGLVFDRVHRVKADQHPSAGLSSPLGHKRELPLSPKSLHSPHLSNSIGPAKFLRDVSRLLFLDSLPDPQLVPGKITQLKVNYFKGNDESRWYCDIPTSQAVLYKNVYDHIDLEVYGMERQIEYDWLIGPGGRPDDIRFEYKNAEVSRVDARGNLHIKTRGGEFLHKKPVCFQEIDNSQGQGRGRIKYVDAAFKKIGPHTYGFKVGDYDKNSLLVIDPVVMAYSTYLGGNAWEEISSTAVDGQGYVYVTGSTWSTDFPVRGQYQSDPGSENFDVFVSKIDPSKKGDASLVYSTYLGGTDADGGSAIAVDNHGYVYVTGKTWSENFPVKNAFQDHLEVTEEEANNDVFVVKLDPSRTGASSLLYSTYLGGVGDDQGQGIAADNNGNAYVVGMTYSTDFPLRNPFQAEVEGEFIEGFVTRLDTTKSGSAGLVYSTYLGGKQADGCTAAAVDSSGNIYVTGWTNSADFPLKNSYQSARGFLDAFVARLNTANSGAASLLFSTYLGGSREDYGFDIAVDPDSSGYAYITGPTRSSDFPTRGSYQKSQGDDDAFVTKLDTTKSGSSCLLYSTYLGGKNDDKGCGISVDSSGDAFVTGVTESSNFPVRRSYQDRQGGEDAFITQLDCSRSGSSSLVFSTYLGGKSSDGGLDIAVDSSSNGSNVYVTGWTLSTDFPVMNQYKKDPGDLNYDGFIAKLSIEPDTPPTFRLSRTSLDFGAVIGGEHTGPQTLLIGNSGEGSLDWTASASAAWLAIDPVTGSDDALLTVSVEPATLPAGSTTGTITISDPAAANSPQTVNVALTVYQPGSTALPFGEYATPIDGSTVSSSIPVTGWVLDDIGVESVKIYRGEGNSLIYIGDAVFVEGARPDIEVAFPGYPLNYRAGWGYMMLTNFLPNGGNGTFPIHAVAVDTEGQQVGLGIKTIIVDNAHAVKPFGALDTPTQGGAAAGSDFINWGWVLTPQPNTIPTDGSTINVWLDGVNLGHPTYNIYRPDIAQFFPGYNNSSGAAGYFILDTTAYANGIHTIQWTAADNAGNSDGIGSRYFAIRNTSTNIGNVSGVASRGRGGLPPGFQDIPNIQDIHLNFSPDEPIAVKKGFAGTIEPREMYPDGNGSITIEIEELQRVEIHLQATQELSPSYFIGRQLVGRQLRPLPIGSSLDSAKGIFSWQPGPGFVGNYRLVFIKKVNPGEYSKVNIRLNILPKHENENRNPGTH